MAQATRARPRIRIGNTEREQLFAILREHYAEGRLSLDELRRRIEIVLVAEYADQAAAPSSSSPCWRAPAGLGAARGRRPRPARPALPPRPRRGGSAAPGWEQTAERFRDPSSGAIMRVWVDPDGARHYVPDDSTG